MQRQQRQRSQPEITDTHGGNVSETTQKFQGQMISTAPGLLPFLFGMRLLSPNLSQGPFLPSWPVTSPVLAYLIPSSHATFPGAGCAAVRLALS